MCTGVWEALNEFQEPVLQNLAASLQATVLASRAPTTASKYLYAFLRWKRWASTHDEIVIFPVCEVDLTLYMQHVGDTTASRATVEEAFSWVQQLACYIITHLCLNHFLCALY